MLQTANPEGIPQLPLTLVFAIAATSCLAGGTLVFFDKEVVLAVFNQLLIPGRNTFYAIADPTPWFYFPIKLFFAGNLFVTVPLLAAWFASTGYRQYARTVALLFVSSILLSSAAFLLFRQYMQVQLTDVWMGGKLQPPSPRGSMTPLGQVPIVMLTLSGPLLASAFVLMRRRRIGRKPGAE
ncbi:hypothetical protein [Polaromonas sp. JS666]|uniref:hypothetical protein n=1 Tax=Polaromonas sp. (strain JS666 / ATCC BAA-500) TaxID=296591 RepID=UPI000941EAE2|nr:hypothetical protein [Polaromonas sp. JS666]